ncbi:acyl-CoA dehydrogenase family protein [Streptomyces sp. SS1-1]|uniref:acyl-CoA dehydrogenase family protein n=1 Tax=Streptomyces sp. SS1-1 TaxID=2651869 RepID=UPI001CEF80F1|nr:acyl-CoA dehydrogenase family protein [Streptomyces sp. SS1-1]
MSTSSACEKNAPGPPAVTGADLVERARALQPLLRAQAERGEADRAISADVVAELAGAGVFRLLTPKRFGGHETDLRTLTDVSEALGEADGSTAWTAMIISVTNWLTSLFPDKAQEEVFGADPDARVTGVAAPTGVGCRVSGGWLVSGKWSYNSGAPYATWAALGALLQDEAGAAAEQAMLLIPASDLTIEDTWRTAGMKGTASNTLIGRDVFVPEHRMLSVRAASQGSYPRSFREDEPLYSSVFGSMLLLCLAGPLLGLGKAAFETVKNAATEKPLSFTVHGRQADSVGVQIQMADAALHLQTARLHVYQAVDRVDQESGAMDFATRTQIRAQAGYAAQQVLVAINTLLNVHGAGAFAESNPLQRIWRDANTAARHAGLVPAVGFEAYGKTLLGVEEPVSLMV